MGSRSGHRNRRADWERSPPALHANAVGVCHIVQRTIAQDLAASENRSIGQREASRFVAAVIKDAIVDVERGDRAAASMIEHAAAVNFNRGDRCRTLRANRATKRAGRCRRGAGLDCAACADQIGKATHARLNHNRAVDPPSHVDILQAC